MTVNAGRVTDASIEQSILDAVGRSTSFARRALRVRSAFFWSSACEPAALIGRAGEEDGIDADALATSFATEVLSATGPVALDASCALGGVAVRAADGARGVLFVADPSPRSFSTDDLALIDVVGASLARELDGATLLEATQSSRTLDGASVPLDALIKMSDALVRDVGSAGAVAPGDYLAAADRLVLVATRLRELAAAETRTARVEGSSVGSHATPEREGPASRGGGATILLADDLDLNRKLISDMLTVEGYQVDCVADGAAALQAVQAKAYDLVLMDMIMPGMDGIAATRAIRALPAPTCRVPIVALTANTFREQLDSCLEAGMDATLTKPMTFDMLIGIVSDWTRGRTAAA